MPSPLPAPRAAVALADPSPALASAVLAVILRVAGPVPTEIRPHALGTPQQHIVARVGDALVTLDSLRVAERIRQHWDATHHLATTRLPRRVSQTWLAPDPTRYPVAICVRLTGTVTVTSRWIGARPGTATPAHLRIQVDRLVWQVCDRDAWHALADAWFTVRRYLDTR